MLIVHINELYSTVHYIKVSKIFFKLIILFSKDAEDIYNGTEKYNLNTLYIIMYLYILNTSLEFSIH